MSASIPNLTLRQYLTILENSPDCKACAEDNDILLPTGKISLLRIAADINMLPEHALEIGAELRGVRGVTWDGAINSTPGDYHFEPKMLFSITTKLRELEKDGVEEKNDIQLDALHGIGNTDYSGMCQSAAMAGNVVLIHPGTKAPLWCAPPDVPIPEVVLATLEDYRSASRT